MYLTKNNLVSFYKTNPLFFIDYDGHSGFIGSVTAAAMAFISRDDGDKILEYITGKSKGKKKKVKV